MLFEETNLSGLWVIEPDLFEDNRGFFTTVFCEEVFSNYGLDSAVSQINLSHNIEKGVWRGLHWQHYPYSQTKLVRCIKGSIVDVAVDIRKTSGSYCLYYSTVLSAANHRALYIPEGFAHGYLTLEKDTDVLYQVSLPQVKHAERGASYTDPAFSIQLPFEPLVISDKDSKYPRFEK